MHRNNSISKRNHFYLCAFRAAFSPSRRRLLVVFLLLLFHVECCRCWHPTDQTIPNMPEPDCGIALFRYLCKMYTDLQCLYLSFSLSLCALPSVVRRPAADAVIPLHSLSSIFIIMDLHVAEKSIIAVLIGMSGARGRASTSRTAHRRSSSSPDRRATKLSLELRINLHFFFSNRHRLRSTRIAGATMERVAK